MEHSLHTIMFDKVYGPFQIKKVLASGIPKASPWPHNEWKLQICPKITFDRSLVEAVQGTVGISCAVYLNFTVFCHIAILVL